MAIGSLGIAQAAAVFLAMILSWHPSAKSQLAKVGDTGIDSVIRFDRLKRDDVDRWSRRNRGRAADRHSRRGPAARVVTWTPVRNFFQRR